MCIRDSYVRFFTEFPMTASGKAQKFKLQEFMRQELNLIEDIAWYLLSGIDYQVLYFSFYFSVCK